LFIAKEREKIIERGGPVWGSPDLIVEVISKGTVQHDRVTKKNLYARFGVKEYWLVDPKSETVQVLVLENGKYEDFDFGEIGVKNMVKSQVLTGFELDIQTIFE
jgi:Uma2 family endonuclease